VALLRLRYSFAMSLLNKQTNKGLSLWGRLATIEHDNPDLTAESWFKIQPCKTYRFLGKDVVVTQPSSSFWVYLLGLLTTAVGVRFLTTQGEEGSRLWWGVSLILWGVGALIAGTSYQAFGYQLKCAGRERVSWTSWWEVIYLIFQQLSINVMFLAVMASCAPSKYRLLSIVLALAVSLIYTTLVFYGAFKPKKSLITYERMVSFCTPFIFFFIGMNGWRWFNQRLAMDAALLGVWFGLLLIDRLYWLYFKARFTEKLWAKGRWFSENDVLHVTLILWVIYIAGVVAPLIHDFPGV
jgi:hypothetical protein